MKWKSYVLRQTSLKGCISKKYIQGYYKTFGVCKNLYWRGKFIDIKLDNDYNIVANESGNNSQDFECLGKRD